MAKPQRTEKPPVDAEDSDRRALAPQADDGPSVQQDEHRGLAARILDLRKLVEEHRLSAVREHASHQQRMAELEQKVSAMESRVDRGMEEISRTQRNLDNSLREGGEQVRVAGELGRKMTDQVRLLEELREMASDPHEVVKPIRHSIALLRGDLEALGKTIDIRFEQLPKSRSQAVESRGEDEQPLVKLGAEIRKLKERVSELESD